MPYAVELFFDAATEAALRNLWDALADAGVSSYMRDHYRPHISLGGCRDIRDIDALTRDLEAFARDQAGPPPITLSHLGVFPGTQGVVFYGVTVTAPLLLLHRRFHGLFTPHAVDWSPYYQPGVWVPHCTLAYGLSDAALPEAIALLHSRITLTLDGRIGRLALVEIPTGHEIATFPLGSAPRSRAL